MDIIVRINKLIIYYFMRYILYMTISFIIDFIFYFIYTKYIDADIPHALATASNCFAYTVTN